MSSSIPCHQTTGFLSGTAAQYSPPPTVHGQSRIAYFITRTNGTPVPLIPADELPYSVKLQHVPRVLTPDQTYGLNYIGNAPYTGTTFRLENPSTHDSMRRFDCQTSDENLGGRGSCSPLPRPFQAPDSLARPFLGHDNNNYYSAQNSLSTRPISAHETSKSWRRADPVTTALTYPTDSSDPAQNAINAILRSQAGAETAERIGYRSQDGIPPPSGKLPDQEKKEWCTYWILHGDCAYVQQGCRYRHEMPDKAKLAEIGINHVPRWWLEQNSAVKLGGDRVTLGPAVKPEVWLNARKGSDADSESSSTDSGASSHSEKPTTLPESVKGVDKPDDPTQSPKIVPARPSTPTEFLINFSSLVPTPSTSTSDSSSKTVSSTPPSSEGRGSKRSFPSTSTLTPIKFDRAAKPTNAASSSRAPPESAAKGARVFVPAGESPEVHIADAKKRAAARNKASRTPSPTATPSKTGENLEKLIREMRKAKSGTTGLSSSAHAPVEQAQELVKRKARTGCRERRPVSASPSAMADQSQK